MATLQHILYRVRIVSVAGSTETEVKDVQIDSRLVSPGSCFIAVRGTVSDGHDFISTAVEKGAIAIVCEELPVELNKNVQYVTVVNSAIAAGIIAHNFYGVPSQNVKLVGVTGTNGKTTVATLLFKLFTELGYTCGLISTVQNQIGSQVLSATHTTPDAVHLNALLSRMVEEGCQYVFMEVSSHALHQHRTAGIHFTGAIFTNITHDHLDYHGTFDEYIKVKKSFFDHLNTNSFALSNADDRRGRVMLQNSKARNYYYSLKTLADFKGKIIENSLLGLLLQINDIEVHFRLIGTFNAYNLLAVYGAAICLGQDSSEVLKILSTLQGAEGRFEYLISPKEKIAGIVDYAHTPDALLNVLATIKNINEAGNKVITVVGCGGNRDKTKRPEMAQVACEYSDRVILTSDNPRREDPAQIIKDMEAGVSASAFKKCISIVDRREAIKTAVAFAETRDIILIAGKGHEKYQEINGIKHDFDDKKVLIEMFLIMDK